MCVLLVGRNPFQLLLRRSLSLSSHQTKVPGVPAAGRILRIHMNNKLSIQFDFVSPFQCLRNEKSAAKTVTHSYLAI